MDLSIRLGAAPDISALEQLIPVSVRVLSAGYYTSEQIESGLTYVFGVDRQLIADDTYFVVEAQDRIVGAGGWSKRSTLFGGDQAVSRQEDTLLDPAKEPARVRAFYVHPDWARRGIARLIIAACEEAARKAGFARTELAATLPGEPMYTAVGYDVNERVNYPLPDGVILPLVYMSKPL